jgi:hypothetical protein
MHLRSIVLALFASMASLQAAVMVAPVISSGSGEFSYNYTVTNNESSSILLFQLTLPTEPTDIDAPPGWLSNSFASGSETIVQWVSEDASTDIEPASSLSGFIIASPFTAGPVAFEVRNAEFDLIDGVTTGPNPVPEPSTALTVLALVALPWARRMMRRVES